SRGFYVYSCIAPRGVEGRMSLRYKKIFHGYVGFWFASMTVWLPYEVIAQLYVARPGASGVPDLPHLGIVLSVGLPSVEAALLWGNRRYVAIGAILFAIVAFGYWLARGIS